MGAGVGLFLAGPPGAVGGAVAGPLVASVLRDLAHRILSHREDARVGGAVLAGVARLQERFDAGDQVRNDDFLASMPGRRSDGEEIIEGVLLAAQRASAAAVCAEGNVGQPSVEGRQIAFCRWFRRLKHASTGWMARVKTPATSADDSRARVTASPAAGSTPVGQAELSPSVRNMLQIPLTKCSRCATNVPQASSEGRFWEG